MFMEDQQEFNRLIRSIIWKILDNIARKIDLEYAQNQIPKAPQPRSRRQAGGILTARKYWRKINHADNT